ncbi:hypothetical protein CBR_g86666, partial [Chara braunii]
VEAVSPIFQGMPPVARHRLVYSTLTEELQSGVHALSLVLKTPSELSRKA